MAVYVAAVCGIAWTALVLLGHRGEVLNLPSVVALYTVAVQGGRRRSLVIGAAAVTWFGGLTWLVIDRSSAPVTAMLWPAAAMLLGEVIRGRRELLAEIDEYVFEALSMGASGFLLKDVEPDELCKAIRIVAAGQGLLAPAATTRVIGEFAPHAQ